MASRIVKLSNSPSCAMRTFVSMRNLRRTLGVSGISLAVQGDRATAVSCDAPKTGLSFTTLGIWMGEEKAERLTERSPAEPPCERCGSRHGTASGNCGPRPCKGCLDRKSLGNSSHKLGRAFRITSLLDSLIC